MEPSDTEYAYVKLRSVREAQGSRRRGLLQDLNLPAEELGLDGLAGRPMEVGDVGEVGMPGEVGDPGGMGALLGSSYDVLMKNGLAGSTVLIEALSSSSSSDKGARSECEFMTELTRVKDVVDDLIVSVSLPELIVDIVRRDTALDAVSESVVIVGAMPASCL